MQHTTWMARHHSAISYLPLAVSRHDAGVAAWIVGIGGRESTTKVPIDVFPTEHLEVGLALAKSGIRNVSIHVFDPNVALIRRGRAALAHPRGVPAIYLERNSTNRKLIEQDLRQQVEYIRHLTGVEPKPAAHFRVKVPEDLRRSIHWHPYAVNEDVIAGSRFKAPQIISCFNVASHLPGLDQVKLAGQLARALHPEGVLVTNLHTPHNVHFIRTLESMLPEKIVLSSFPLPEGNVEEILAFHKSKPRLILL